MEGSEKELDALASLDEVARAQATVGERVRQPRWVWLALGACLGLVHATLALPPEWDGLAAALAIAGVIAMIAIMCQTRAVMTKTGEHVRWWGGPWWLVVFLAVAVVTGIVILRPLPTTPGWHPGYLVGGVVLAVVYALGATVADRIRTASRRDAGHDG